MGYLEGNREVSWSQLTEDRYLKAWWNPPTRGSGGLIVLDRWEVAPGHAPRAPGRWWRMGL